MFSTSNVNLCEVEMRVIDCGSDIELAVMSGFLELERVGWSCTVWFEMLTIEQLSSV